MTRPRKLLVVWTALVIAFMAAYGATRSPAMSTGEAVVVLLLGGVVYWLVGAAVIAIIAWVARKPPEPPHTTT